MKRPIFHLLAALALIVPIAVEAETPSPDAAYLALVERIASGKAHAELGAFSEKDGKLGLALRRAYAASSRYLPYDRNSDAIIARAGRLIRAKDYRGAMEQADKALARNYANMRAHLVRAFAARKLGDEKTRAFHDRVYAGLYLSLLASGDGKSPETAYWTINIDEQNEMLWTMKLRKTGQSLVRRKSGIYDRITAVSRETGKPVVLFFDVTGALRALSEQMRKTGKDR